MKIISEEKNASPTPNSLVLCFFYGPNSIAWGHLSMLCVCKSKWGLNRFQWNSYRPWAREWKKKNGSQCTAFFFFTSIKVIFYIPFKIIFTLHNTLLRDRRKSVNKRRRRKKNKMRKALFFFSFSSSLMLLARCLVSS